MESKKPACVTPNFGIIKPPMCGGQILGYVGIVLYNPETKEVFNEFEELIGHGEYENGILSITHKLAEYGK